MEFNQYIDRYGASALIPIQDYGAQIIEGAVRESATLNLFTRLPNMTAKQAKIRVLDSLPTAYWVDGDTGLKETTNVMWRDKFIEAEELAVIVPIPDAVRDDMGYDVWAMILPRIVESIGQKIDQAVWFGKSRPVSYRASLYESIVAAGALVPIQDNPDTGQPDLYKTIDVAMSKVEKSGYNVTGMAGGVALKSLFRNMRDTTGQPLQTSEILSIPRALMDNGAWDSDLANLILGDFSQAMYAIRQDVTIRVIDQGVISNSAGEIQYNLPQQDMTALRVVMRLGWQIPNPINALAPDEETRFPFSMIIGPNGTEQTKRVHFDVAPVVAEGVSNTPYIDELLRSGTVTMAGMTRKLQPIDGPPYCEFNLPQGTTGGAGEKSVFEYKVTARGFVPTIGVCTYDSDPMTGSTNVAVSLTPIPSYFPGAGGEGGIAPGSLDDLGDGATVQMNGLGDETTEDDVETDELG